MCHLNKLGCRANQVESSVVAFPRPVPYARGHLGSVTVGVYPAHQVAGSIIAITPAFAQRVDLLGQLAAEIIGKPGGVLVGIRQRGWFKLRTEIG